MRAAAAFQKNCKNFVALFGVWYTIYLNGGLNLLTSTKNLTVISRAYACVTVGKSIFLSTELQHSPSECDDTATFKVEEYNESY